jgi:hypothetical protein
MASMPLSAPSLAHSELDPLPRCESPAMDQPAIASETANTTPQELYGKQRDS